MQCRACLQTNCKNIIRLHELNIKCFNLITDLNIHLGDRMPQQLCEKCTKDLKYCFEFREKCITSNSILISAQTSIDDLKTATQIKQEVDIEPDEKYCVDMDDKVEIELKDEYYIDTEHNQLLLPEDNIVYEYVSDVKPLNIGENKQKSASNKEKTRRKTPRAVKKGIKANKKEMPVNKKYDCGLCTVKIEKDKLCDHVRSHETNNYCGICSLYFKEWEVLLLHRIFHLKTLNFVCHICLRVFENSVSLECHYNVKHLGKSENGVKCVQCDKSYTTVKNLKKHWQSIHADQKFKCRECSEEFLTANTRRYHIFKHHKMKKKLFCNDCDYSTELKTHLRRHQLRVHTAAAEKIFCKLCKAQFVNESRLKRHKCQYSTHSVCPICGIVFEVPVKLKEHLASHSDERKHKCDRCDAAYKTRGALRVHLNKHDGVRAHKCEYCPAAFWAPSTLIKHRRTHTGEKPYVCKVCNRGFTGNHNLKLHMRVHGVYNLIKKKSNGTEEDSMESVQECNKSSPIDYPDTL